MWRSHWERRVEHTTREGDAPEGNGAGGKIHTDLSSVRKSRKADEFSLQSLIKDFAKGKTQHVISMESRDHGPSGRTGTRIGTGRTAAGRAGSFNPEEQRSSRFRSYGPPLREECKEGGAKSTRPKGAGG